MIEMLVRRWRSNRERWFCSNTCFSRANHHQHKQQQQHQLPDGGWERSMRKEQQQKGNRSRQKEMLDLASNADIANPNGKEREERLNGPYEGLQQHIDQPITRKITSTSTTTTTTTTARQRTTTASARSSKTLTIKSLNKTD